MIHAAAKMCEEVNRKCSLGSFYNFQPPCTDPECCKNMPHTEVVHQNFHQKPDLCFKL